jgi:hypothetical protein
MKRSSPRVWDLIGCGVLLLWGFGTELAFAIHVQHVDDYAALARVFAFPLLLGAFLLLAGLFGRTLRARWQSRGDRPE